MRKGIKSHWRPVFDTQANATTANAAYQTVLNLTKKIGRAWFYTKMITNTAVLFYVKITIDGVVVLNDVPFIGGHPGSFYFQGEFDFEDSFKVEHKTAGGTIRTNIAYYAFSI